MRSVVERHKVCHKFRDGYRVGIWGFNLKQIMWCTVLCKSEIQYMWTRRFLRLRVRRRAAAPLPLNSVGGFRIGRPWLYRRTLVWRSCSGAFCRLSRSEVVPRRELGVSGRR